MGSSGLGRALGTVAGAGLGFMVGGPAGAVAGGMIGYGAGGMLEGEGESDFEAQAAPVDRNDFILGGTESYEYQNQQAALNAASVYSQRNAYQLPRSSLDYRQANEDYAAGLVARQQQADDRARQLSLGGVYMADMQGAQPSLAQAQLQQGMNQQMSNQLSLAASARGGAANQLLAQRAAMAQNADASAQLNQQQAILRAQEYAAAREGYAHQLSGMREGDTAMRAQDLAMRQQSQMQAQSLGQFDYQQNAFQAQLEQEQRARNDAMARHQWDRRDQIARDAQQGRIAYQQTRSGAISNANALNQATASGNAQARAQFLGGMISAGAGMGAAGIAKPSGLGGAGAAPASAAVTRADQYGLATNNPYA